jgi:hypothetical protein
MSEHIPNPLVLERLAWVLKVPGCYFCTRDDLLADLMIELVKLNGVERRRLLMRLRRMNG